MRTTRIILGAALVGLSACGHSPTGPTTQPDAPAITCPANINQTTTTEMTAVTYTSPVVSGGTAPANLVCSVQSGASLPVGTTVVTCNFTDAAGRTATCGFNITLTLKFFSRYTRYWAFGDSLTEGKAASFRTMDDFPGSYPDVLEGLLAARYTQQTFTMGKYGCGGQTAEHDAGRLRDLLSANPPPQVLLLLEGSNDLTQGDPEISFIVGTLGEDIDYAKSHGVLDVLLATLPPVRAGSNGSKVAPYLDETNAQIRALAAQRGAGLVDLFTAMTGQEATLVGNDGLHLTAAGYKKVAETFFDTIKGRLEVTTPPAGSSSRFSTGPSFSVRATACPAL
jgi:lysophospholipase L1-like esterase